MGRYNLMYVIADENDVVRLRTDIWHSDVHLYPIKAKPEQIQRIFLEMLERQNKLREHREAYSPFTNSCAVNLARHANTIVPGFIPRSYKVRLFAYTDSLVQHLGLIDTKLPFEEMRRRYRITDKARATTDEQNFSQAIRS